MDTTSERTVSGRTLIVVSLVVVALVIAAGILFGPALREDVRQTQVPRTLREPIAAGRWQGQVWEAVGRYDGTSNCVELRYRGDVLDRACDTGPRRAVTALPDGGPTIVYGVEDETATEHTVSLDSGADITAPVRAGDLGFPVGFWAAEIPRGASVEQ